MDETVDQVNAEVEARIRARFTNNDRLTFVDLASLLSRYDAKHDYNNLTKKVVMEDNKRLSKRDHGDLALPGPAPAPWWPLRPRRHAFERRRLRHLRPKKF